ncbi:hypothetical protein WMY93_029963 [Mugilogobius chulae]|uniref:Uncharacterized protein n=1 Tax=Mugilogobius chulae TaxID=88201 RepID=A0AAW0MXC0_9GOBI
MPVGGSLGGHREAITGLRVSLCLVAEVKKAFSDNITCGVGVEGERVGEGEGDTSGAIHGGAESSQRRGRRSLIHAHHINNVMGVRLPNPPTTARPGNAFGPGTMIIHAGGDSTVI